MDGSVTLYRDLILIGKFDICLHIIMILNVKTETKIMVQCNKVHNL